MCTRARLSEGLDGAALEDGVLQVVSKPTLAIARTGQCAGIWRMARVGLDGTHGMAYGAGTGRTGVRQEGAVLDICPVWVSWTDEDVGFVEGVCVTSGPIWMWPSCGP